MPVFDTPGDLITSTALALVIVAAFFYVLFLVIRAAVWGALRRQYVWAEQQEHAKSMIATGSAMPSGRGSWENRQQ